MLLASKRSKTKVDGAVAEEVGEEVAATKAVEVEDKIAGGRGRGRGGRGPETRYHSPKEWNKLSQEQRIKILETRGTNGILRP
jgi:hypothetical protein